MLDKLIQQLEADLESLVQSALIAKEAATSEESKAENKYDTRGLEASYLAGAQAKRSEELKLSIIKLKRLHLRHYDSSSAVGLTAQVTVQIGEQEQKCFFILPVAGGVKLQLDKVIYYVITPESTVGSALMGKKLNDEFEIQIHNNKIEYEITGIQ